MVYLKLKYKFECIKTQTIKMSVQEVNSIVRKGPRIAPKKEVKESVASEVVQMDTPIEELDELKSVLENKEAQRCLIELYSQSQMECTRNGKCGMEIGMAREKDLAAILKMYLKKFPLNLAIDNELPEDYVIGKRKISAKHATGKISSLTVRAKWTSADEAVEEAITYMIQAEDTYYTDLLVVYFDMKNKKITIICISAEHIKHVIKEYGNDAFKIPSGNSRGIEYTKKAMTEFLKKKYFTIEIENVELKNGADPITRRIEYLTSKGFHSA